MLRTEQIELSYGRRQVLCGLDLDIPEGRVYGFLGRNGAGKTTAIKVLLGILVPQRGTIHFACIGLASLPNYLGTVERNTERQLPSGCSYVSRFVVHTSSDTRNLEYSRIISP